MNECDMRMRLGRYAEAVDRRLAAWEGDGFGSRLWEGDHTLWAPEPQEIADRLGWLHLARDMSPRVGELTEFAREVHAQGVRRVVLLGMGGSSLAPEVFQRCFANPPGSPELSVLDSTHPDTVRRTAEDLDPSRTLFVVSSKSGTTVESLSLFHFFWDRCASLGEERPARFVAITDPGSSLEALAGDRGFRAVFPGPPTVGGRFSALSVFGMVPAALIGVDLQRVLDSALHFSECCVRAVPERENPGLRLGAALGELAVAGRDKVVMFASRELASFPDWAEQLLAESTGKKGAGILPVVGEPPMPASDYGDDRVFVEVAVTRSTQTDSLFDQLAEAGHPVMQIRLRDVADIGAEFFRWEFATAAAGAVLGINPFDQPDVELAKKLARGRMADDRPETLRDSSVVSASDTDRVASSLGSFIDEAREREFVGVQAYVDASPEARDGLADLCSVLRARLRVPVTLGIGPRYLHSTGQLHKGGANTGAFLQLTAAAGEDLPVPETDYTFARLIRAQAEGDLEALRDRKRLAISVDLGRDVREGLALLAGVAGGRT